MTDQVQPLDITVNQLLTMVRNQMTNISALVETHAANVTQSLDSELNDYNGMVEALENADENRKMLELKCLSLEERKEELELQHAEELNKVRKELNMLKIATQDVPEMRKELKRLKEMDPDSLKDRLAKTKSLASDRLDTINKLKREQSADRKKIIKLETTVNTLTEASIKATEIADDYQRKIEFIDGSVEQKTFKADHGLEFFIYKYGYPLSFRPQVKNLSVIRDLDFHIELRTNWAICCIVSVSDWLIPLIPTVKEFEGNYPTELYKELQRIYEDVAKVSHQHLIDRVEHFKEVSILDTDVLSIREVRLLNQANYFSIYSVMHPTDKQLADTVIGIGLETASKIRERIDKEVVQPWEKANWTKEQVKEVRR
ncbi:TPA: hypothetical protein ACRZ4F_001550 [Vibrio harveyi]